MRVQVYKFDGSANRYTFTIKGMKEIINTDSPFFRSDGNPTKSYIHIDEDILKDIHNGNYTARCKAIFLYVYYYKGRIYTKHKGTIFIATFNDGYEMLQQYYAVGNISKSQLEPFRVAHKQYKESLK